jgi:hypothetical protein
MRSDDELLVVVRQRAGQLRSARRRRWGAVTMAALLVGGIGAARATRTDERVQVGPAANQTTTTTGPEHQDALDDVELVGCGRNDLGFVVATVKATNNSSERSNFWVSLTFTSRDGLRQSGAGFEIHGVAPNQAAQENTEAWYSEEMECEITAAVRTTGPYPPANWH